MDEEQAKSDQYLETLKKRAFYVVAGIASIWVFSDFSTSIFLTIVVGIPAAIWWLTKHEKAASTESTLEARRTESASQAADNKRIISGREGENVRVHHVVADDGEILVDWRRQFEEINKAWRSGDYDFARDWLQKLAYRLKSEEAPEAVHIRFKALMVEFTRDDPLFTEVMRVAMPVIVENPGVIQSQLSKQFPQFDAEQFRYAMYYAEVIGDVIRQKKGRSYALSVSVENAVNQMATAKQQLISELICCPVASISPSEHAKSVEKLNHRKAQMLPLIQFRPHWMRAGPCSGGEKIVSIAGDVPCPCTQADFSCRLNSLTPRELSQFGRADHV